MKRPRASLVIVAVLPFVVGCFGVVVQPVPEPIDRAETDLVGVVMGEGQQSQRVEFSRVDQVQWSDLSLSITGVLGDNLDNVQTRSFELPDLSGVLVQGMDGTKTSILLAGVMMGAAVIAAFVVTGDTENNTILGGTGG